MNSHVELLDAAYPGSLPVSRGHDSSEGIAHAQVVDLEAIRLSILTALALRCTIVRLAWRASDTQC